MERLPSFMGSPEPRKGGTCRKRSRSKSTPTGKTPLQKSKHASFDENKPALGTERRTKWTAAEKECLFVFVQSRGPPTGTVTAYWEECSKYLYAKTGSSRSGKSCGACYDRELAFSGCERFVMQTTDSSSQTELTLPVFDNRYEHGGQQTQACNHRGWSFLPNSFKELKPASVATSTGESIHKLTLERVASNEILTENERCFLLQTLLNCNLDTGLLAEAIYSTSSLKDALWRFFLEDIEACASSLSVRSSASYLYNKAYDDLASFSFQETTSELLTKNPMLASVLLAVAMPTSKIGNAHQCVSLVPKLALVHSILQQARFQELSRLQKVITVLMLNEHTHQKIYDQLQPLGVCQSSDTALNVVEHIGGYFNSQLIDAVKEGKRFRLIGDNVNFSVGVKYERSSSHKHMQHWFASAAIIQPVRFDNFSAMPQKKCVELNVMEDILPNKNDIIRLKCDYISLISRVVRTHMKNLPFIPDTIPHDITSSLPKQEMSQKNTVVPLPVDPLNEQYYADVVKILDTYESYVCDVYKAADVSTEGLRVHIGGDQLTRERFSGAKRLRDYCTDEELKLSHLQPNTFELFHLAMKFLSVFFKRLFSDISHQKGTMNGEKIRISRHSVNPKVKEHYDADKDFAVSFINAYIVEALREFFGMEDATGYPTKHIPPRFSSPEERNGWVRKIMAQFIEEMVWDPKVTMEIRTPNDEQQQFIALQVSLPDGSKKVIFVPVMSRAKTQNSSAEDKTKIYGHNVLRMGLLYLQLLDICKSPCRERLLYTLKMMMIIIKTQNPKAKYALEILRFLCHQQATLSLRVAYESVYGLFVNNIGKHDSHIPADLQMEHLVRRIKNLLKALGPNKGKEAVKGRCKALAGMGLVVENYDETASVLKRAKKHKFKNALDDEQKMIQDLKALHPFSLQADRFFEGFQNIQLVTQEKTDLEAIKGWISHYQNIFDHEIGV